MVTWCWRVNRTERVSAVDGFAGKAPEIQAFLADIAGQSVEEMKSGLFCATCGKPVAAGDFRDALSEREFGISRMCQSCQDSVFGI